MNTFTLNLSKTAKMPDFFCLLPENKTNDLYFDLAIFGALDLKNKVNPLTISKIQVENIHIKGKVKKPKKSGVKFAAAEKIITDYINNQLTSINSLVVFQLAGFIMVTNGMGKR